MGSSDNQAVADALEQAAVEVGYELHDISGDRREAAQRRIRAMKPTAPASDACDDFLTTMLDANCERCGQPQKRHRQYRRPVSAAALKLALDALDADAALRAHDEADCPDWGVKHHELLLKADAAFNACVEAGLVK